jgi:hypothetical protein
VKPDPTQAYGDFTQDDIDMAIRHDKDEFEARPIRDAIQELQQMFAHAQRSDALIRPSFQSQAETILLSTLPDQHAEGARAMVLFRLVAHTLDAPTARSTLRGTLELASSSAAVSLREHLPRWLEEIAVGNVKPATLIANEIAKANAELSRSSMSKRGKLFGYVAVAVDVVDAFLKIVPVFGLSVQLIDEVHKRKVGEREQRNRWILLGERDL